ncbi:unnamed protein product [Kuraishia capsulata CBS 1993]|uniref:Uncharacterized protein n=1 Tax=Kuraishia capsulata CBS 1993 TaxID=1382522 RepID=W6MMX0_9ASCO|nr:uncharacterized protein KUCA_T00003916001 [Kuraishia capsulata CBS 1993]CDK27936.1 unnamed protein product [Kuraishia capsulata CBS 1993]
MAATRIKADEAMATPVHVDIPTTREIRLGSDAGIHRSASINSARNILPQRSPRVRQCLVEPSSRRLSMSPQALQAEIGYLEDRRRSSLSVLSDAVDVGPQPLSEFSGSGATRRRSSLRNLTPEAIIDSMEREQESVVLRLMNEIYSLKQQNTELKQQLAGALSSSASTTGSSFSSYGRGNSLSLSLGNNVARSGSVSLRHPPAAQPSNTLDVDYDFRKLRKKEDQAVFNDYSLTPAFAATRTQKAPIDSARSPSPPTLENTPLSTPPIEVVPRSFGDGDVSPKNSSFVV